MKKNESELQIFRSPKMDRVKEALAGKCCDQCFIAEVENIIGDHEFVSTCNYRFYRGSHKGECCPKQSGTYWFCDSHTLSLIGRMKNCPHFPSHISETNITEIFNPNWNLVTSSQKLADKFGQCITSQGGLSKEDIF